MSRVASKQKMRHIQPLYIAAACLALVLLVVVLFVCRKEAPESENIDPNTGQVRISDGANEVWISPIEGVEAAGLTAEDFRTLDGLPCYIGSDYTALQGIDISEYQSPVDWAAVKADGIDFVIIRCGWRGYASGLVADDVAFAENIRGALKAGLQVGVYFFSQAVTPGEAKDEADTAVKLLRGYDIQLPVFFDWERPGDALARTQAVELSDLTEIARAFCDTIEKGGYVPGLYFNRQLGYYAYDWSQFTDCAKWVSDPNAWPDFYYQFDFWQYSFDGAVNGISIQTDRDLMLIKK